MKRLICQKLYSNIGKDLALHGPRTIVTEENSDFVYTAGTMNIMNK